MNVTLQMKHYSDALAGLYSRDFAVWKKDDRLQLWMDVRFSLLIHYMIEFNDSSLLVCCLIPMS